MFVVAVGNPFDGIALYGPFRDTEHFTAADAAGAWAEEALRNEEWWLVNVTAPGDHE